MCTDQFAANLLGGGGDFLLGSLHHFSEVVFGGFLDAGFFGFRFFFGGGLHPADFDVHLAQTILDVGEALVGFLTGFAGFFQGALDRFVAARA